MVEVSRRDIAPAVDRDEVRGAALGLRAAGVQVIAAPAGAPARNVGMLRVGEISAERLAR